MQTPICQKRPNFRIPYFCLSKCRPLHSAARGGCPLRPLPAATVYNLGALRDNDELITVKVTVRTVHFSAVLTAEETKQVPK